MIATNMKGNRFETLHDTRVKYVMLYNGHIGFANDHRLCQPTSQLTTQIEKDLYVVNEWKELD